MLTEIKCECGCGQTIIPKPYWTLSRKKGYSVRFIPGHSSRVAYKAGLLTGLIMDGSNNRGKRYDEKRRKNQSISHLGQHNSPATEFKKGLIPHNKGKNHFLETRIKISQKRTGDKIWAGFITPIRELICKSIKYSQWRQDVFIRDDFTCQKCGKRGGYLHAHHVKGFAELLKEVKENLPLLDLYDGVMVYTPFWDILNGKTLCKVCHNLIHRKK